MSFYVDIVFSFMTRPKECGYRIFLLLNILLQVTIEIQKKCNYDGLKTLHFSSLSSWDGLGILEYISKYTFDWSSIFAMFCCVVKI